MGILRIFRALPAWSWAWWLLVAAQGVAWAAPPGHVVQAQGALQNLGGGGVADGNYTITVRLYATQDSPKAEFKEIHVAVPVKNGLFTLNIGSSDPAVQWTAAFLGQFASPWLSIQIEAENELPRVQVAWTPYAIVADTANSLNCTGCIGMAQLAPDVSNTFVKAAQLADIALTGNFNDLSAKPPLVIAGKSCDAGQYAIGSAPNGSLLCAPVDLSSCASLTSPNTFTKPQQLQGGLGVGKALGAGCGFDVSSAASLCVDGQPATVVRTAASQTEMDKLAKDSQLVYRSDNGEAYFYRKGVWRKLLFAPMCGDGLLDPGEECDDGNKIDTDGCSNACKLPIAVNVTFTSCTATGQNGPTQAQCNTAYAAVPILNGKVTVTGGIQTWTVPADGTYRIEAFGGQGAANVNNVVGGKGARIRGDFALKAGQVLKILVGEMGAKSTLYQCSGGGGGTFVALSDNTLLLAAGGGGGVGAAGTSIGVGGTTVGDGTKDALGQGTGGTKGGGGLSGSIASVNGGGGGGGYSGDGTAKQTGSGYPGKAFLNGGQGGLSRLSYVSGGFGGGGGGQDGNTGGGGGGGYSGGSGGQYFNLLYAGGGGGGSYNTGTTPDAAAAVQSGDGKVTVLKL